MYTFHLYMGEYFRIQYALCMGIPSPDVRLSNKDKTQEWADQ